MVSTVRWPWLVGVAAVAGTAGFGLSRCLASPRVALTPPVTSTGSALPQVRAPAGPLSLEAASLGDVKVPEAYLAAASIGIEPVVNGSVASEILAPAVVEATPGAEASVIARASGTLKRIDRHLGDDVKAGDVLGLVESFEATTMAMDRRVAATKVDLARRVAAREADLFHQGVTPRQDFESAQAQLAVAEAEASRARVLAEAAHVARDGRSLALVSPISGRITASNATLGGNIEPATEVFRVAKTGAVHVEASLPVGETARINAGDSATILPASGEPVAAVVRAVTPAVDPRTQAATAVILPAGPAPRLRIGEGVRVRLHGRGPADGSRLVIAEDAVQNLDGRDIVFVRTTEGFRAVPVLVGTRSGGLAEIVSGVRAGERVATRNAFLLKAEMNKIVSDDEE